MRRHQPKLCHHRARQVGYVTVAGKQVYLRGRWPRDQEKPSQEIQEQYDRLMAELLVTRYIEKSPHDNITFNELYLGYLKHCETWYVKNGKPTSELPSIKSACKIAARLYGREPAKKFGPLKLQAVRQQMIELGWTRDFINKSVSRIRRMFRWGVKNELIEEKVWRALQAVEDLRKWQIDNESTEVEEVTDEVFEKTVPKLPGTLSLLARVHRLIGCRADEVCGMKPNEFRLAANADGDLWKWKPDSSKTNASYWLGPKVQAVLKPLLEGKAPDEFLFVTRRRGEGHWTTASYRRCVNRICKKHGIPIWTPLQVRHRAGQEARDHHPRGVEATQARLQHKEVDVSQIYAHNIDLLAQDVARKFG